MQTPGQIAILRGLKARAREAWRDNVPLDARVFLETLAGNRGTLTEEALSPRQRAAAAEMIQRRQAQRVQQLHQEARNTLIETPQAAADRRRNTTTANRGQGYISREQYSGFGGERAYNLAGDDDRAFRRELEATEQVRTTLGRFRYEMTPEGIRVSDTYDFNNPERSERVQELATMPPLEKAAAMLGDYQQNLFDTPKALMNGASLREVLTALGGSFGNGMIGDNGRPVDMLLPYVPLSRPKESR